MSREQTDARPLGERVARLEVVTEDTKVALDRLLSEVRAISSALASITNDSSLNSRRIDEIAGKLDDLATTVTTLVEQEQARTIMVKTGLKIMWWLACIGGGAIYVWSNRYAIVSIIAKIW